MFSTLDTIDSTGGHPVSEFCLHGRDRAALDSTSAYEVSLQSTRQMNIYLFCVPAVI